MKIVVFDLETGGLDVDDPNIQLGAVAMELDTGEIIGTFERKIQFDEEHCSSPDALKLNSYDRDTWLSHAVPVGQVLKEFNSWLRDYSVIEKISKRTGKPYHVAQLAGYNSQSFDMPRLRRDYEIRGMFLPADWHSLDAMQLFAFDCLKRGVTPTSHRLQDACELHSIEWDDSVAHDALYDAQQTARLLHVLFVGSEA